MGRAVEDEHVGIVDRDRRSARIGGTEAAPGVVADGDSAPVVDPHPNAAILKEITRDHAVRCRRADNLVDVDAADAILKRVVADLKPAKGTLYRRTEETVNEAIADNARAPVGRGRRIARRIDALVASADESAPFDDQQIVAVSEDAGIAARVFPVVGVVEGYVPDLDPIRAVLDRAACVLVSERKRLAGRQRAGIGCGINANERHGR